MYLPGKSKVLGSTPSNIKEENKILPPLNTQAYGNVYSYLPSHKDQENPFYWTMSTNGNSLHFISLIFFYFPGSITFLHTLTYHTYYLFKLLSHILSTVSLKLYWFSPQQMTKSSSSFQFYTVFFYCQIYRSFPLWLLLLFLCFESLSLSTS